MPRVPRINIENALYYVTSRGDNDQEIFKQESDYRAYIDLLKRAKDQYKFMLFAFCLLPNHVHLLIELKGSATISQIMHTLNSNYIKYFNSKYNRAGHLFQERYKMVLLEKTPYLLMAMAYIHMNPSKLGLTAGSEEYPYSSYSLYISDNPGAVPTKDESREVREYLKGRSYQEFIKGVGSNEMESFGKELSRKTMLGSDEFIEKIKNVIEAQKLQLKEGVEIKTANKKFLIIGGSIVLLLGIFSAYFYGKAFVARERLKKEIAGQNAELAKRLKEEKDRIKNDIDEKYRADMVSFEALSKRLEIEKVKAKELESKLKTQEARKK